MNNCYFSVWLDGSQASFHHMLVIDCVTHLPDNHSDLHILIYTLHTTIYTSNPTLYFPKPKHVCARLHTPSLDVWGLNFSLHWFNRSSSVFQLEETYFSPCPPWHCGLWERWNGWLRPSSLLLHHHTSVYNLPFTFVWPVTCLCYIYKCQKMSSP